jgi:hypothetical protein
MATRSSNNPGDHEVIRPIAEFYSLISGYRVDERDWQGISALFAEGAMLSVITDSESSQLLRMNVREYLTRLSGYLSDKSFHESGSNFDVFISNNIASVCSVYTARIKQESGETRRSGVNLVQLIRGEERWKIISMLWQDDS